ncbi:phosphoribosylanthranilate isomerase [Panacagrimonas sp.]|uniref:phosphoribosylanthranilate isomerase n=1 Tax=Panacagrimonas sp. TaxID=2480088 RepID=UPI003B52D75B
MSDSRFPIPDSRPHRTRIKFCGFTRAEDLSTAVGLGVDAVGLVCVPGSKRELSIGAASELRRSLPPFVDAVLLLSNASFDEAAQAIATVRPDYVQFHGRESAADCERHGCRYLKGVSVTGPEDIRQAARDFPGASALLLDSHGADGLGGTGQAFDWTCIPHDVGPALILAGGLNPDNVGRAVRMAVPYAVDVSSGIESGPGRKDPSRMRAFVEAVRLADAQAQR